MKRILYTLLVLLSVFNVRTQTVPTHEVNGGFNAASYDSDLMEMSHPFATYYYDMYPQWTNHIYSWSRGGSAFPGDYQNQEGKRLLPLFHSFDFPGYNWNLANDNGGLVSNTTASALLDIASLPPTNYNAVAGVATNEGITMPAITTQPLGRMPHDSPDGDSLAISGNSGSMGAAAFLGVPKVDLWHHMYTPKFVTDQAGARKLWSGIGGSHFSQAGYLAADLFILQDTGAETNVGSFTLNWNAASISATNHVSLSGLSVVGATLSATVHFDRMPPGFDVPDGTITNDARAFAEVYPELGNALNWIVQVTNLPTGNYTISIDGSNIVTLSSANLAAGYNMFTNYQGALWAQRKEVLGRKRDQAGVDRVSLVAHGAGSQGTLGVADLVNYESDAGNSTEVYPAAFSGNNYITHMAPFVSQLRQYDLAIWQAAQQTNHTLTITQINPTSYTTIDSSATNQLTSDAKFRLFVGNSPADNSVQSLNPPIFKWVYFNDPWTMGYPGVTLQTFRFQLSTNGFTSTYWDITTSNNFYNCLPSITNADGSSWMGTNYWHIVYMGSNATTVISTGAVHTFTLASTPTLWDRSQFADTNYLIQTGIQHPHVFVNTNTLAAMRTYLHGNTAMGFSWNTLTNTAKTAIAQSWWNDNSVTNQDVQNIAEQIADVCLTYQIDSNAVWKAANPGQMVSRFATMFITSNLDQTTPYNYNEVNKFLPLAYDWAYSDMTTAQRSNVLWVMERMALFMVDSDWWYSGTAANTNRLYADALKIDYESAAKAGHSHPRGDSGLGLYLTWSGMGESAVLRDCQNYFLNYCVAQVDPYNGDEGRGYAEQLFRTLHNLSAQLLLATIDSRMTNNPWFIKYPKMFCYWEPLNYVELQDQFGDFGMQKIGGLPATYQYHYKYYDMSIMSLNPYIYQQFTRNFTIKSGTPDFYPLFGEAFLPFYFPTVPSQADWPDTYYYDPVDGWCMSYAYAPNNWNCFTNGVGFVMSARPAGNRNEHGSWHDGAPQIFAYGAQVTCGGIGQYNKHPIFYDGLFVDGIGDCTPNGTNPTADWYSRFTAFTNSTDFTFCRADLSQAFNNWNTNSFAGGGLGNLESAYNQATNRRPYITSVQRSLIFPHKKYVVLYDTFQTTTNATFAWKWNIMEPTAVVNTNAFSLTYTSTNFFNGSNVSVYVQHIVDPTTMTLFYGYGTNYAVSNIFTTEDFTNPTFPTAANEPKWASTIWVYNTAKTNQWHFMSVIFPVKWGDTAPTITRIDDNTVRIQQGTIDDSVTFDPNSTYSAAQTRYKVDLNAVGGSTVTETITHFRAHR